MRRARRSAARGGGIRFQISELAARLLLISQITAAADYATIPSRHAGHADITLFARYRMRSSPLSTADAADFDATFSHWSFHYLSRFLRLYAS
jgi:hypothetical protein